MSGRHSLMTISEGSVSSWEERSSQERASMRAMRASIIEGGKERKRSEERNQRFQR
jgi:hypothetical protein